MNCSRWKKINDFIEISETGKVKSHGKIINGEICKNGYQRIHVSNNGKHYKFLVHRLVAQAFILNPDNLPQVNHKDGNKQNNHVNNLEWCNASDNLKHAYKAGLRTANGERNNAHKLTETEVSEIKKRYVRGKHSECNSFGLAKLYGVSSKCILNIVNGTSWKHVSDAEGLHRSII